MLVAVSAKPSVTTVQIADTNFNALSISLDPRGIRGILLDEGTPCLARS